MLRSIHPSGRLAGQDRSAPLAREKPTKHAPQDWDYLIVTASNDAQARAYESQLKLRHRLRFLPHVRHVLVVADPEGRRVGSGGSTLCCLMQVVNREVAKVRGLRSRPASSSSRPTAFSFGFGSRARDEDEAFLGTLGALKKLRILIIHAGGDSRRLPAYGPCGKIFIPVPGQGDVRSGVALFDRIAPAFLKLPPGRVGWGQIVIAAGDALILFDPSQVSLDHPGLTALACPDTPEQASKHGVFCPGNSGQVRRYLQKPSPAAQRTHGALNRAGHSLLDIGIMSFDSTMAAALFRAFGIPPARDGQLIWPAAAKREVLARGVDFFREICCAMGEAATAAHHRQQAWAAGSGWSAAGLKRIFDALVGVPFHLEAIPQARFLHFGTTRQLITSGFDFRQHDRAGAASSAPLSLNNAVQSAGKVHGADAWVEGCRLRALLSLGGQNVVIGVNVDQPLTLPENAGLDVLRGASRAGKPVWFVRLYGIGDTFKDSVAQGGTFCGMPLWEWLAAVGAKPAVLWDRAVPAHQRSLWNARVFPAETTPGGYRRWLWMYAPAQATPAQRQAFLAADRYSAAEINALADQEDFFARRRRLRQRGASAAAG